VETANRFARDLIVQETGHRMLKGNGIEIIATEPAMYSSMAAKPGRASRASAPRTA
jgi:hypothetical protein